MNGGVNYVLYNSHGSSQCVLIHNRLFDFQSQPVIFTIQVCRMQGERREGYELQLVMEMVTSCQWDGATVALKSQELVVYPPFMIENKTTIHS